MNNNNLVRNRDVMTKDYTMIDGIRTVAEAIQEAVDKKVKTLIVKKRHDDDEYGMVLMSDIARKVLALDKSPDRVNVYEIMIKPVLHISTEMDIRYTARLFERFGISKAPVIEAGEIIGIVNYHDLVLKGMIKTDA